MDLAAGVRLRFLGGGGDGVDDSELKLLDWLEGMMPRNCL
jgi:hypothetical protein